MNLYGLKQRYEDEKNTMSVEQGPLFASDIDAAK